jgi:hypothetical protein
MIKEMDRLTCMCVTLLEACFFSLAKQHRFASTTHSH